MTVKQHKNFEDQIYRLVLFFSKNGLKPRH